MTFKNTSDKKMTVVADPEGAAVLSPGEEMFVIFTNRFGYRIEFQFSWGTKTAEVPVSGRHFFDPEPGRCFMQGVATIVE